MRFNLVRLIVVLLGFAASSTSLQSQNAVLVNLTNQAWRYFQSVDDPGAFWLPEYDDSSWAEGRGVFAYETSSAAALMTNVYPHTNTILLQPMASGLTVVQFRTRFVFDLGDPDKFVLVASNLIDDGYVMYLNGVEIDRFNMHPNDTLAAQAISQEGVYVVRPLAVPSGVLTNGANVLAVRVHQNNATSTDVVWGTVLHASPAPASFRDGVAGYNSTQDTELHQGTPDANVGQGGAISVDLADPAPIQSHGLLRFDRVFGGSPGQIPFGAIINRAAVRLYTTDATDANTPVRLLRMLKRWEESSTWNSMVNGIDETNGVETGSTEGLINGVDLNAFDDVDVTAAVQAWVNGEPNYGWAFLPTGSNGWDFASSENATIANRPALLVDFMPVVSACSIVDDPDSVTLNEKQGFTLSVVSRGTDLNYQWYKDDTAIAGATADTYVVGRAVPADAGRYYVVAGNDFPIVCTSATAVVTVTADLVAPALTSALGNWDQTTITLTFNDSMDPLSSSNTANYTLSGGLGVSNAAVSGNTVTLTTAPRMPGTDYTLSISGITDDAVARNSITPTTTNLAQEVRFLAFGTTWKFDTNGLDLGTSWKDPGYDDSGWPAAGALLGWETGASTLTALAEQGLNTNNATLWPLTNSTGTQTITYYARATVNIPFNLSNATVTLRHVTDDGAVFYFNGEERFRFNMPAGPIGYLTEADVAPAEGVIRTATLTNVNCGNSLVAVSIHNDTPTSTDILFGAEVLATFTSFQPCGGGGGNAILSIVNNGNGTVTLSWAPAGGTLEESADLTTWAPSANQGNPQTFAPVGMKFYRVP
jgi:hypothetical protein